jgi:hypothetical protein
MLPSSVEVDPAATITTETNSHLSFQNRSIFIRKSGAIFFQITCYLVYRIILVHCLALNTILCPRTCYQNNTAHLNGRYTVRSLRCMKYSCYLITDPPAVMMIMMMMMIWWWHDDDDDDDDNRIIKSRLTLAWHAGYLCMKKSYNNPQNCDRKTWRLLGELRVGYSVVYYTASKRSVSWTYNKRRYGSSYLIQAILWYVVR